MLAGLGCLLIHDAKHPSMQVTQEKNQNVGFIVIFLCIILNLWLLPPGLVHLLIYGAKDPSIWATQSLKLKFWLYGFLSHFFDLQLPPTRLGFLLFHGAKQPSIQATQSKKISICLLCHSLSLSVFVFSALRIALFPCLFLDLFLLTPGLGTLFIP